LSEIIIDGVKLVKQKGYLVRESDGVSWHRIVYRKHHKVIPPKWHIHHIDADKLNNEIDNLIAVPEKLHSTIHQFKPLPGRNQIQHWLAEFVKGHRPDRKALRKKLRKAEVKRLLGGERGDEDEIRREKTNRFLKSLAKKNEAKKQREAGEKKPFVPKVIRVPRSPQNPRSCS
jgi:hypothetical protein